MIFTNEYYQEMRDSCAEMSKAELDNVIMGQVMAFTSSDATTRSDLYRHPGKQREQVKSSYYHKGHQICWKTFTHLHGIGNITYTTKSYLLALASFRKRQAPKYPSALFELWTDTKEAPVHWKKTT